ncbi:MAG: hypothetical protein ACP5IL_07850 [Syntrophobacteraceae bacterium]
MSVHDIFTAIASVLAAIITVLLTSIHMRLGRIEDKLDNKQDRKECEMRDERYCKSVQDIWDAFGRHSHEGLAPGSKVTR